MSRVRLFLENIQASEELPGSTFQTTLTSWSISQQDVHCTDFWKSVPQTGCWETLVIGCFSKFLLSEENDKYAMVNQVWEKLQSSRHWPLMGKASISRAYWLFSLLHMCLCIYVFTCLCIHVLHACSHVYCVCVYLFMRICLFIYMCLYVCANVYTWICIYVFMYVYMHACLYAYVMMCMSLGIYVFVYVNVCMCLFMYVYVFVYVYMCLYV